MSKSVHLNFEVIEWEEGDEDKQKRTIRGECTGGLSQPWMNLQMHGEALLAYELEGVNEIMSGFRKLSRLTDDCGLTVTSQHPSDGMLVLAQPAQ